MKDSILLSKLVNINNYIKIIHSNKKYNYFKLFLDIQDNQNDIQSKYYYQFHHNNGLNKIKDISFISKICRCYKINNYCSNCHNILYKYCHIDCKYYQQYFNNRIKDKYLCTENCIKMFLTCIININYNYFLYILSNLYSIINKIKYLLHYSKNQGIDPSNYYLINIYLEHNMYIQLKYLSIYSIQLNQYCINNIYYQLSQSSKNLGIKLNINPNISIILNYNLNINQIMHQYSLYNINCIFNINLLCYYQRMCLGRYLYIILSKGMYLLNKKCINYLVIRCKLNK